MGLALPPDHLLPVTQIAGYKLPIAAHLQAKRSAVAAHASQYSTLIDVRQMDFACHQNYFPSSNAPTKYSSPMNKTSRSAAHFERLYRADPDPWSFANSPYEQQKYEATLALLDKKHFRSALEVGCSIGILTSRLASRCDQLIGLDFAPSAVKAARARCAPYPGVRIEQMQVPQQWPEGFFDLILFSEVLYFLDESDVLDTCAHALRSLLPGGQILLVNYTEQTDDPLSGDKAASVFIKAAAPTLRPIYQTQEPHYRLDLLGFPS